MSVCKTLTAMSYNVLCRETETPEFSKRVRGVCDLILEYLPDTVGVQEATPTWMKALCERLCDVYDYVGEGRDGNGEGEYSAVFYKKDKFECLESATKWLSDTPDVPSKYEMSKCTRVVTYAKLRCKADGKEILAVNTHIDHRSEEARQLQIKKLFELIEGFKGLPTVFTGDFNTQPDSPVYRDVVGSYFDDSFDVAKQAEKLPTYHGYARERNIIIDFVFVSRDCGISVEKYDVLIKKYDGEYPSDHYPVLIEYSLN